MIRSLLLRYYYLWFGVALAFALLVAEDVIRVRHVAEVSAQGNPAPEMDAGSPTGYVRQQRYFLGAQQRGQTFRWIEEVEQRLDPKARGDVTYHGDNAGHGRRRLSPSLYAWAGAAMTKVEELLHGEPAGVAVERAAVIAPLVMQIAILIGLAVLAAAYSGFGAGTSWGLFLFLLPLVSNQFLPGVLEARALALGCALGAFLLSAQMGDGVESRRAARGFYGGAVLVGIALWLDPAVGVPTVLMLVIGRVVVAAAGADPQPWPWLQWGGFAAAVTALGCICDHIPLDPTVSELRYVHPIYLSLVAGLSLLAHSVESVRIRRSRPLWPAVIAAAALILLLLTVLTQVKSGFAGWLFPSETMQGISLLSDTPPRTSGIEAIAESPWFVALPVCAAIALTAGIAIALFRLKSGSGPRIPPVVAFLLVLLVECLVFAMFRARWWVVAVCVAGLVASVSVRELWPRVAVRARGMLIAGVVAVLLIAAVSRLHSVASALDKTIAPADVEALVYRDFAQWLSKHSEDGRLSVLAPPDMSDSLIYHANARGLVSTAWENRDGLVLASRVLSASLSEESESLLRNRRIDYLVMSSWDKVLPHIVRAPKTDEKDALGTRLQRWAPPPFLRPIPYRLPPAQGLEEQTIALYRVGEPQEEALALSRLTEYFVEMDKGYLATAAARVLGSSFPRDPNAAIARAYVFQKSGDSSAFAGELAKIENYAANEEGSADWDRRVNRAIVLALGGRRQQAATELAECLKTASAGDLYLLTSLQLYRMNVLAQRYRLSFTDPALNTLASRLADDMSELPAKK